MNQQESCLKAIAVFPGKPNHIHLTELPMPSVNAIPNGRGVPVTALGAS